jgi:hypothetical protein
MKHPDDMTVEEARSEADWLKSYFDDCARDGHGVSSKEGIRYRLCKFKVDAYEQIGLVLKPGEDVGEFMRLGQEMFAPVGVA